MSSVAVKHSDAGGEIQPVSKKNGTHLAVENTSQEMVETAEMPMSASRRREEGRWLGTLLCSTLADHEELAYQFDKNGYGLTLPYGTAPKYPQE